MDDKTLDLFNEMLVDLVQETEPESFANVFFNTMDNVVEKDIDLAINFVLYILYTVDKVSVFHLNHGFKDKEEEYYEKLLAIEDNLEECFSAIEHPEVFKKAVEVYASHINQA